VHDLLHEELDAILEAHNPRAYFLTAIRNAGIDLQRRNKRLVRGEEAAPSLDRTDESPLAEEVLAVRQEAERLSATLSSKERQVFAAIAAGEEREDIARAMGTSRANIDQIVSRARKRIVGAP
jgi:RNA polymerase sigma factor (sigma-70 family)